MNDGDKTEPLLDPFSSSSPSGGRAAHRKCQVSYELLFWLIFLTLTAWAVIDRFYGQLWLLKIKFKIPEAGTNWPGPVPLSVSFFDRFGRIFGRVFLTTLNALFFTQCKTIENLMMEHAPSWVHMGDLRTSHNKIHYILGVFFMGIPMVLHIWFIFLPVLFAGQPLVLTPQATAISPFLDEAGNIILTTDNIYRLVVSTVAFCILFPISMANSCRIKNFSGTQWLHLFAMTLFSLDQIRNGPHAQPFNAPMFLIYIIDRVVGIFFYRTGEATIIHHLKLDEEYTIVFFYIPNQKRRRYVGSVYYLGFGPSESQLEIAHPYACFQNHGNEPLREGWKQHADVSSDAHAFSVKGKSVVARESADLDNEMASFGTQETTDLDEVAFFSNWNTAAVVQTHHTREGRSWSARVQRKSPGDRIRYWGPYLSEYAAITPMGQDLPPLVLVASGGGAPFIMDFYLNLVASGVTLQNPVTVYFSTNSLGLFQFVSNACAASEVHNWTFNAHLTRHDDLDAEAEERPSSKRGTGRNLHLGRASFEEILSGVSKDTQVYFCGNAHLMFRVEVAAAKEGLTFYSGHRFNAEGPGIACMPVGKCKYVTRANALPAPFCY